MGTYGVMAVRTDIDPSGGQQGDKEYVPSTDIFYFSIEGNNSVALAEIQAPKTVEYTGQPGWAAKRLSKAQIIPCAIL